MLRDSSSVVVSRCRLAGVGASCPEANCTSESGGGGVRDNVARGEVLFQYDRVAG